MEHEDGVFGVDLTLTELANKIAAMDISKDGGVLLFDDNKHLLANSSKFGNLPIFQDVLNSDNSIIKSSLEMMDMKTSGKIQEVTEKGNKYYISHFNEQFPGANIHIVIHAPQSDFNGFSNAFEQHLVLISILGLIIFIPVCYVFAGNLSRQVVKLSREAKRIEEMNFSDELSSGSKIIEFDDLITSFHKMNVSLAGKTNALDQEQEKLSRLVELGIAMSAEKNSTTLMEMVLLGAKELTNADGGTLYTLDDEQRIQFQIVRNDSLDIQMGGTSGNDVMIPPVSLFKENGAPNHSNVVSFAIHNEQSVNITDAYNVDEFDFSGTKNIR